MTPAPTLLQEQALEFLVSNCENIQRRQLGLKEAHAVQTTAASLFSKGAVT